MGASTCSARILQPIKRYVDSRGLDPDLVPRDFWTAPADSRVSLDSAHAMLDCAVDRLRDRGLGIKLGRSMCFVNCRVSKLRPMHGSGRCSRDVLLIMIPSGWTSFV